MTSSTESNSQETSSKGAGEASQTIFRDEALEYIATPNDVNKIIRIVSPHVWVLVMTFLAFMAGILLWVFWGSIPITLQGQGILVPKNNIFKTINTPEGVNTITSLSIKPGDMVTEGQVLAHLENLEMHQVIQMRIDYLKDLKQKKDLLLFEAEKSMREKKEHKESQTKLVEERLANNRRHQQNLQNSFNIEKKLLEKGYSKRQNLLEIESQLTRLKTEDTQSQEELIQLSKESQASQEMWDQKLRELALKISDEERDLNNLTIKSNNAKVLKSSASGKVVSVDYKFGDQVTPNTPFITISQGDATKLEGLIYLNPMEGKEVHVGMKVYMVPTHLEKEYVGHIEGEIIEISQYPETARSLMMTLQNEDLVKKFIEKSPPISAKIAIKETRSLNEKSVIEQFKLSAGTWVYARIVVEQRPPIGILVPEIKRLVGTAS